MTWEASVDLKTAHNGNRTVLSQYRTNGPLYIQKLFYHRDDPTAHAYLVHPPGGICRRDRLEVAVTATERSQFLLTTPGAGKFYRGDGAKAFSIQHFEVKNESRFYGLLMPTIVYNGALCVSETTIDVDESSEAFFWEIWGIGLPANRSHFLKGTLNLSTTWKCDRQTFHIDRLRLTAESAISNKNWSLAGKTAFATLYVWVPRNFESILHQCKLWNRQEGEEWIAVTSIERLIVIRVLADRMDLIKIKLTQIIQDIHCKQFQRAFHVPRVWHY